MTNTNTGGPTMNDGATIEALRKRIETAYNGAESEYTRTGSDYHQGQRGALSWVLDVVEQCVREVPGVSVDGGGVTDEMVHAALNEYAESQQRQEDRGELISVVQAMRAALVAALAARKGQS